MASERKCVFEVLLEGVFQFGIHHGQLMERILVSRALNGENNSTQGLFTADHISRQVFLKESLPVSLNSLERVMAQYDPSLALTLALQNDGITAPQARFYCSHHGETNPSQQVVFITRLSFPFFNDISHSCYILNNLQIY